MRLVAKIYIAYNLFSLAVMAYYYEYFVGIFNNYLTIIERLLNAQ